MFSKNMIHMYMLNTKNDYFRKVLTNIQTINVY